MMNAAAGINSLNRLAVIAKKELHRFFKDWRMIIITLVFPAAMLYFIYAIVVPNVFSLLSKTKSETVFYSIHPSTAVSTVFSSLEIELTLAFEHEEEAIKKSIAEKSNALLIVFPIDFDALMSEYNVHLMKDAPEISIYYNSLTNGITEQYGKLIMILNEFETSLVNKFDINKLSAYSLLFFYHYVIMTRMSYSTLKLPTLGHTLRYDLNLKYVQTHEQLHWFFGQN